MKRRDLVVPSQAGLRRLARFIESSGLEVDAERLVRAGCVFVDGRRVREPEARLDPGARLVVHTQVPELGPPPIEVLFEDEDIIVLDKPAGWPVNESETSPRISMVEELQERAPGAATVHRLDRDTSGVLLMARSPRARAELPGRFKDRLAYKRYLALAEGEVTAQTVDVSIGGDRRRRRARQVSAGGKSASTELRPLGSCGDVTAVQAEPFTGRTHQIRVHLAHIGAPILGDKLYGGPTAVRLGAEVLRPARVMLHAARLRLPLFAGERAFDAPIPEDMLAYEGHGLALGSVFA